MQTLNPSIQLDYSTWGAKELWTNAEAACLIAGLDPNFAQYEKAIFGVSYTFPSTNEGQIAKSLYEVIRSWGIGGQWMSGHPFIYIDRALCKCEEIHKNKNLLNEIKSQFSKELKHNPGLKTQYPWLAESIEDKRNNSSESSSFCPNPLCQYSTPLLKIASAAIKEHWLNFDRDKPPTQENIIQWIQSNFPKTSDNEAKAVARLIQHESRSKGGNVRTKKVK